MEYHLLLFHGLAWLRQGRVRKVKGSVGLQKLVGISKPRQDGDAIWQWAVEITK
jgi:hypothetical protein